MEGEIYGAGGCGLFSQSLSCFTLVYVEDLVAALPDGFDEFIDSLAGYAQHEELACFFLDGMGEDGGGFDRLVHI